MINNFDAAHRLLNAGEGNLNGKYPSFRDKLDLFFVDYDWVPLLVQEGYLNSMQNRGRAPGVQDLEDMANASEFISLGDSINTQLRTRQDWSLLPNLGMCAAVAPAMIIQGKSFYPRFPEWLGKNSSQRKSKRQIKELKAVMGMNAYAKKQEIQEIYVPIILRMIYKTLTQPGGSSTEKA